MAELGANTLFQIPRCLLQHNTSGILIKGHRIPTSRASTSTSPTMPPSRLQQAVAALQRLTTLELEAAKSVAQWQIDTTTPNPEAKYFEPLPTELKDRIYFFVALQYLSDLKAHRQKLHDDPTYYHSVLVEDVPPEAKQLQKSRLRPCGLLLVSRSIRANFLEVLYSTNVTTLYHFPSKQATKMVICTAKELRKAAVKDLCSSKRSEFDDLMDRWKKLTTEEHIKKLEDIAEIARKSRRNGARPNALLLIKDAVPATAYYLTLL